MSVPGRTRSQRAGSAAVATPEEPKSPAAGPAASQSEARRRSLLRFAGRRTERVDAVAALLLAAAPGAGAAVPNQRTNLRVLLLSADGNEPSFEAWKRELEREQVPYDSIIATQAPDITAATLSNGSTANYQAVILPTP